MLVKEGMEASRAAEWEEENESGRQTEKRGIRGLEEEEEEDEEGGGLASSQ